ncbi:hypothetical protein N7448_004364 [Penicillium atrosanguineum]|uniref:Uncharacterized protein n=1 Tax=Penicillium atrosanguineum TaxID=1132637 RepID=A0A9W9PXN9_9EURO|nr:uncharacterized protein N7443_003326 [Penicillium atrosanguineum]KAJ5117991.1 hypothetical protein N7526_011014 [Penicillium atrosanguineum]KAJ5140956.1 hypothetical protein N7448_004364 [Penicillium atrosanguineum]KAJ5310865.1 hypothetical protein N7443_003326 [Penicillium atrosanguineum]KAJ5316391.1 hypothetical protein N7476_006698 [Penicillium atrosanguineum]
MRPIPPIALRRLPQLLAGPARRTFVSTDTRRNVQPSSQTPPAGKATETGKFSTRIPRVPQRETQTIEHDGEEVTLRMFQHPKSPSDGEHLTALTTSRSAKCYLHFDELTLARDKERPLRLPYYYLRDLCKCPQCVDPHSKQRSFRTHDIHPTIHPRRVKWDGNQLEIQWNKDILGYGPEHTSRWPYHYLRNPINNTHDTTHPHTRPFRWNAATMEKYQHWISFDDYMHSETKFTFAMQNLARLGLVFVKDIPSSREMVEKVATRMGPLRNSFYGSTWDVRTVPQAKNVAYTNQHLGFHMDLLYMNEPPGYQLLHCLENSCEGGESLFADTFNIADRMKRTRPTDYWELTRRHVGYEYVHEDSIYHNTWPVFELDPQSKELRNVNYSPPFQSAIPTWKGETGKQTRMNYDKFWKAMYHFTKDMESKDSVFQLKLNPGECVIFANRRVVHARNKFNTTNGSRWLAGAYVDQDAVLSRFAVTRKNNLESWVKSDPRVVNQLMPGAYQGLEKDE